MKVSTMFEVDTTNRCLVIAILLATYMVHDLVMWPLIFWPWSMVIHGGSTKFEDPTAIHSWVMHSDSCHRIPFTMRLQPLRMRRITWPMRRWQIFPTYLKSLTLICLFTIQLLWRYDYNKRSYLPKQCCHKSFTTIVLGDHDFPLTTSTFGNLTAFRAILAIFSRHLHRNGRTV